VASKDLVASVRNILLARIPSSELIKRSTGILCVVLGLALLTTGACSDTSTTSSGDDTVPPDVVEPVTPDIPDVSQPEIVDADTIDDSVDGNDTEPDVIPVDVPPDTANDGNETTVDATDADAAPAEVDVFDPLAECDDENPCTIDSWDGEVCINAYEYGICCTASPMCDDDDTCTLDLCVAGLCVHESACCEIAQECSDGDALCTQDDCVDGWCVYAPVDNSVCCSPVVVWEDFDDGELGTIKVDNSSPLVGWHVSTNVEASAESAVLWYGSPDTQSYSDGTGHQGTAAIGPLSLPAAVGLSLHFDVYLDIETMKTYDLFEVRLVSSEWNQNALLWNKESITTYEQWETVTINLTAFAGQEVQIFFFFDSIDDEENDGLGVLLDNIGLDSTCATVECVTDEDCSDGFVGTADRCLGGHCASVPNTLYCEKSTDCDDGEPCTSNACSGNLCIYPTLFNCCLGNEDCDDGLPCTVDDCVGFKPTKGGFCNHITKPDCCVSALSCNDADPCSIDDCPVIGESCTHTFIENCCSSASDCDDGNPCTSDECGPSGCFYTTVCCSIDADCDDGDDLCTADTCNEGVCAYSFINLPGCCTTTLWEEAFTGASQGAFSVVADSTPGDGVMWHSAVSPAWSDGGSLRYGSPGGTYDTGASHSGMVTSTTIALPVDTVSHLRFMLHLDNEWSNGVGNIMWDRVRLRMIEGEGSNTVTTLLWDSAWGEPVWWKSVNGTPVGPQWTAIAGIDLSAYAGQNIRLRFEFDTIDAEQNGFGGATIDDVQVFSSCSD
jgi:hypothetical protein